MQTFTYSLKPALASGKLVEILAAWRPAPIPFTSSMPGTGTCRPGSASLLNGWRRFFRLRCRDKARYLTQRRGWSTIERTDRYFSFLRPSEKHQ